MVKRHKGKLKRAPPASHLATSPLAEVEPKGSEVPIWETKRAYRRESVPSHCRSINRTSFDLELATSPNEKSSRTKLAVRERCDSPTSNLWKAILAAAAGAAAIAALVAASVAGHDGAALRTQRRIRGHGVEWQFLLRAGFGGAEDHGPAHLADGIFRTQELSAQI